MSDTLDFAGLLKVLNFTDTEFVSIGHYIGDGEFSTAVRPPDEAPGYAASLPDKANAFFSVNAVKGPTRERAGRGKEADITRLADLPVDLDICPGKCPDAKTAMAIIFDLSVLMGTRPSALTDSGHGVHAHWVIEDGAVGDGDVSAQRALVKRWGRLVAHVAEVHHVKVDPVFDLPRMMRVPGSSNNKGLNGEAPQLVTARLDTGGPLSMAEASERLDEAGIVERVDDRVVSTEPVSPPEDWRFADRTCSYVAKMINRWDTDRPALGEARNPFIYNRFIRLFCALRNGCVSVDDYQRTRDTLERVLTEVVTTTEPRRNVRHFEIADMNNHGMARAASKTDEEVRAELGGHNHPVADNVAPAVSNASPNGSQQAAGAGAQAAAPTTWEVQDLGPWLNGTITTPTPDMGLARSDGVRFLYPGKEHAVLGETESGKTWFALGCVVAELLAGNTVLYFHYEEGDPGSTIERLQLLGVNKYIIATQLRFVAPDRPPNDPWIYALLYPVPTLVVHDGVNEAMAMMGAEIKDVDGASTFRRRLVTPFLKLGAASLACDHLPMNPSPGRRDAYGTVHKGNALNGARFQLENAEPFGRGMRGVSHVFVTKDRPGYLRTKGRATKVPGKTYMGTLVVDDEPVFSPFHMLLHAPKDKDADAADASEALANSIHALVLAQTDSTVGSMRALGALVRLNGERVSHAKVRDAVDELLAEGRLIEVPGPKRRIGYQAVVSAP